MEITKATVILTVQFIKKTRGSISNPLSMLGTTVMVVLHMECCILVS